MSVFMDTLMPPQAMDVDLNHLELHDNQGSIVEANNLSFQTDTATQPSAPMVSEEMEYIWSNVKVNDHLEHAIDIGQLSFDEHTSPQIQQSVPSFDTGDAPDLGTDSHIDQDFWYDGQDANDFLAQFNSTDWDLSADPVTHGYELRTAIRDEHTGFQMAYGDYDETGDYDPEEENRQKKTTAKKRSRPVFEDDDDDDIDRDETQRSKRVAFMPQEPVSTVLRFFDDNVRQRYCALLQLIEHAQTVESAKSYDFRRQKNIESAEDVQHDEHGQHLGHPEARGCKRCREFGERCSLLDNEFAWPCTLCNEEGDDCALIVPPVRKLACIGCVDSGKKEKWLICSFLYDEDTSGPCLHCASRSQDCIAGPDPAHVQQRVRIGDDGEPDLNKRPVTAPKRTADSCRRCQESQRHCSFENDSNHALCTGCDMAGTDCERISIGKGGKQKRTTAKATVSSAQIQPSRPSHPPQLTRTASEVAVRQGQTVCQSDRASEKKVVKAIPSAVSTHTRAAPSGTWPIIRAAPSRISAVSGTALPSLRQDLPRIQLPIRPLQRREPTRTIRTKFCHPIVFNYDDFEGDDDCHFCKSTHLPVIGLEQKNVLVKALPKGQGWEEIEGGHAAVGMHNTKVCSMCTLQRVQIIACGKHEMKRIEKWNPISLMTAINGLISGDPKQKQTWCSVCCNVARWICCTGQGDRQLDSATGCGLVLCEHCTILLIAHTGNLDAMLRKIRDETSKSRPLGLRADHALLRKDGLLLSFITNGQSDEQRRLELEPKRIG